MWGAGGTAARLGDVSAGPRVCCGGCGEVGSGPQHRTLWAEPPFSPRVGVWTWNLSSEHPFKSRLSTSSPTLWSPPPSNQPLPSRARDPGLPGTRVGTAGTRAGDGPNTPPVPRALQHHHCPPRTQPRGAECEPGPGEGGRGRPGTEKPARRTWPRTFRPAVRFGVYDFPHSARQVGGEQPPFLHFLLPPALPGAFPPVVGKSRRSAQGPPEPGPRLWARHSGTSGPAAAQGGGTVRSDPGGAEIGAAVPRLGPAPAEEGVAGAPREPTNRSAGPCRARWPPAPAGPPPAPAAQSPVSLCTAPSLPLWPSPPAPSSAMVLG